MATCSHSGGTKVGLQINTGSRDTVNEHINYIVQPSARSEISVYRGVRGRMVLRCCYSYGWIYLLFTVSFCYSACNFPLLSYGVPRTLARSLNSGSGLLPSRAIDPSVIDCSKWDDILFNLQAWFCWTKYAHWFLLSCVASYTINSCLLRHCVLVCEPPPPPG